MKEQKTFASWLAENVLALVLIGTSAGAALMNYNTRQALTEQGVGQFEIRLTKLEKDVQSNYRLVTDQQLQYAAERAEMRTILIGLKASVEDSNKAVKNNTEVMQEIKLNMQSTTAHVDENRRRLERIGG